jgi:hypothetical protein
MGVTAAGDAIGESIATMSQVSRGEKRLILRQMSVAGEPFEPAKVGLIEGAAAAERSDGTGRAAAEEGTIQIWRDGSYHCLCSFGR